MNKLGILGAGNMGSAIINGIKKSGMDIEMYAYDAFAEKLSALPVIACNDEISVVKQCKYVLLSVKPQMLAEVLDKIAPAVTADTVFISICAGISAEFIRKHTISTAKVVLVMPNTPMMLGLGASAMSRDSSVGDSGHDLTQSFCAHVSRRKYADYICFCRFVRDDVAKRIEFYLTFKDICDGLSSNADKYSVAAYLASAARYCI